MLQNLHVKNLALIEETEVEFDHGLNILSGETGAGKSIIIGSINLALGEKFPKEMLRDETENAFVELIFSVEKEGARKKLRDLDVELENDMVILSRKISSGRAVGRVNGEAVSVSKMKEIASCLIDIHGQHEHQSLLSKKNHLEILDNFAKEQLENKKEILSVLYQQYKKLKDEYEDTNLDTDEQRRELSLLEYEVAEIEEANLSLGEDEVLEQEFKRLSNGRKIIEATQIAQNETNGEQQSASERIGRAFRELSCVADYDAPLESLRQQLGEIDNLLSDFNRELSSYISDAEFDEETFEITQKRLDLINRLKTKYGDTMEEILTCLQEKKERIAVLYDYDHFRKNLSEKIIEIEKKLKEESENISKIRKEMAQKLCDAISQNLKELNFLDVKFTMEFNETQTYTAKGMDDVQFLISTNPGEPLKPLHKIASGGEISRIMLAIKSVMAESDEVETLIFDEIDSGISGRTAQMVSEKMNALGKHHQIICITHLPQIAAMADSHFLIEKSVENHSTISSIYKLNKEKSVNELARMIGGVEITETVLQSAREMKDLAYMKK